MMKPVLLQVYDELKVILHGTIWGLYQINIRIFAIQT